MDILVTTPKREHEAAEEEAAFVAKHPDAYWFRTLRGNVNVQVSDKVYYVDNGQITGYGIVFGFVKGRLKDEGHEGKIWVGTHLKQRKWHWLQTPVPFKGFQGFRYVDRIPGLREKLTQGLDQKERV